MRPWSRLEISTLLPSQSAWRYLITSAHSQWFTHWTVDVVRYSSHAMWCVMYGIWYWWLNRYCWP